VELGAAVLVMAAIFVWGAVSARLERADLSAPIVFTLVGALLVMLGLVDAPSAPVALKPLVEITLVWVLFSDAAGIRVQDFRHGVGRTSATAWGSTYDCSASAYR
jgi:sodium/hydrogen antiporter